MNMNEEIKIELNRIKRNDRMKTEEDILNEFTKVKGDKVAEYHRTLPHYKPTPLVSLASLAEKLNINNIWVKDESKRFNLNAFKVLGASFAFAKHILGDQEESFSFENVQSKVDKVECQVLRFVFALKLFRVASW